MAAHLKLHGFSISKIDFWHDLHYAGTIKAEGVGTCTCIGSSFVFLLLVPFYKLYEKFNGDQRLSPIWIESKAILSQWQRMLFHTFSVCKFPPSPQKTIKYILKPTVRTPTASKSAIAILPAGNKYPRVVLPFPWCCGPHTKQIPLGGGAVLAGNRNLRVVVLSPGYCGPRRKQIPKVDKYILL